jgi:hypothetical protein
MNVDQLLGWFISMLSPLARYFLLLRQKKVSKENATLAAATALALNSFSWLRRGTNEVSIKPAQKSASKATRQLVRRYRSSLRHSSS